MKLSPEQVRAVQLTQLECMVEIDRICREQGLRYYMIGGTLLGAVRHKGFIPWDDDLDIAMPRKDYDRFVEVGQRLLGNRYFLQNYETDAQCFVPFSKVRINHTVFKEESVAHLKCHHGIFVDIFPLDVVSSKKWKRKFDAFIRSQLLRIINAKLGVDLKSRRWLLLLRRVVGVFFSIRFLGRVIHNHLRRYQHCSTGCLTCALSLYGVEKELLPPAGYGTPVDLEFEGHKFFAPAQSELLLSHVYGDFMQLPPEDDRGTGHAIVEVEID